MPRTIKRGTDFQLKIQKDLGSRATISIYITEGLFVYVSRAKTKPQIVCGDSKPPKDHAKQHFKLKISSTEDKSLTYGTDFQLQLLVCMLVS